MRKPFVILVLLFVFAAGGTILWLSCRPTAKVTVSFQGFTNDSQGVRFATFCITNCTANTVRRWGNYGVETPQTLWTQGEQPRLGPEVNLKRGEAEVVSIPAPTNGGAWKAVLFYSQDGWRCRLGEGH